MALQMIGFLVMFPLVVAALLLILRSDGIRSAIVWVSGIVVALASCAFVVMNIGAGEVLIEFSWEPLDHLCTAISCLIVVTILAFCVKYRNVWAALLAVVQLVAVIYFESAYGAEIDIPNGLYFDSLTLLMVFIIGVIGSGICIYAIGYMKDFQAHEPKGARDRRPTFFALMFLFLAAMFAIVFSNNMEWLFTGWEVTTVCSFLLIGYTKTPEAIRNAFRQIIMNLAGGIGFVVALYVSAISVGTLSFNEFISVGMTHPELTVIALIALAFAGITKAAQMPFQTWLLGAMVAPTPTSALLHSSTMVKAGVFLLIKLAPLFLVTPLASIMVMLVGAITFLLCSFMAISQTNAKRVLAYSTIANLGLITACAGVGTPEAVWAAGFLILFHAAAKSLLFLCVGTAEHHIGSRDIEAMDLLFDRMPRLARFMMLGIMCMFIAPFGMLIAKWAAIVSFVDMNQVALLIILAFGSAATFMFWAKWLGKLAGIAGQPEDVELTVHRSEWFAIMVMAVLVIVGCVLIPLISDFFIEPYVVSVYGFFGQDIATGNLWLASICVAVVVVVLFCGLGRSKARRVDVYLSGVSRDDSARSFQNALSGTTEATVRNWYMKEYFGEDRIAFVGVVFNSVLMAAVLACAIIGLPLGL